jgi:hypothetical protein
MSTAPRRQSSLRYTSTYTLLLSSRDHLGGCPHRPARRHQHGLQDPLRRQGLAAGHHRLAQGEPHRINR